MWINTHAAEFAKQEGISEDEARRRLAVEGAARVDAKVNKLVGNENVDAAATAFLSTMGGRHGFIATEDEYTNFNLYGRELLKYDALYRQVFNSLLGSSISRDDLNYTFFDLNNLRGTVGRGRDGQMILENFTGDVGAVGGAIGSLSRGDGNGAAITAATFLIPVRVPGGKIIGEVGVEIAGTVTREVGRRAEEIGAQGLTVASGKFDYLFGRVVSNSHNASRSNQLALEMKRLGVPDNAAGRQMLIDHLAISAKTDGNVINTFSNKYGKFEVRESLFMGPSGRAVNFQSTFQVLDDGTRVLSTVIPRH